MKPAIIQHTEYKRMLRTRLNAYFPDKSEIQKEIAPLYRKFRDLDLSAVDRIMQSHYSNFGPIPWSPSNLLRAMLVMVSYKCVTFTRWVTELRVSPILAIICGFAPEHIPGVGTFYNFMTRLWDLPTDNFTSHIKKPQAKKPKKTKGKGQKAESIESESVAQLIARLSQTQFCIDNEAYCTLHKIFRTCFLDQSISFGLLNPEKLRLAGDGTPVVTAARARSHHVCDCIKKGIFNCECPRYFPQPDCNVGWDSSRDAWYFGYDLYLLTDSENDLPVFPILHQASKHDSHSFCESLPPQRLFGPDGVPVCQAGLKMKSHGNDLKRQYAKFICPMMKTVSYSRTCSCSSPCSSAKYGRTCSVPLDSNIRLYNSPPRGSKEWKETYNGRTSAERCNKRMKLDYLLEDAHHHAIKFWYIRVYLIMMVLHLDAWSSLTEI